MAKASKVIKPMVDVNVGKSRVAGGKNSAKAAVLPKKGGVKKGK